MPNTLFDTLSQHFAGDARLLPSSGEVGAPCHSNVARLTLYKAPNGASPRVSEALRGEALNLIEDHGDWALVETLADHYLGYAKTDQLALGVLEMTHRVTAPQSHLYPAPNLKHPPLDDVYLGALLNIEASEVQNGFLKTHDGAFVYARHIAPISETMSDPVDVALGFLDTPYLWGGRTRAGIDCSGLVQIAFQTCGIACPRDSDMQAAILGNPVALDADLQYGDVVFFPGHVGLMVDDETLLHANAFHMAVTLEPLCDVVDRLKPDHAQPVTDIRRL